MASGYSSTDLFELESIKLKLETTQTQLRQATQENTSLTEQLSSANETIAKYKNLDKELIHHRQTSNDLTAKLKVADEQILQLQNEKQIIKKEITDLKKELENSQNSNSQLQAELHDLKSQSSSPNTPDKRTRQLNDEVSKSKKALEEKEKEITDIKWEKKKIEELYTDLIFQNRQLQQERKENLRCLEEARDSLMKLRAKAEDKLLEDTANFGEDESGSLADELQAFEPNSVADLPPPSIAESVKNREDYFHLAVASVNISGAIRNAVDLRLDGADMYAEIQQSEVPFHEWYDWIIQRYDDELAAQYPELVEDPEPEDAVPLIAPIVPIKSELKAAPRELSFFERLTKKMVL